MNDIVTPWRVEATCTRYRNKQLYQLKLRDDRGKIVCFGFGRNPTAAYLRLSTHAQGIYSPLNDWSGKQKDTKGLPVIDPRELPLALLALERYVNKK